MADPKTQTACEENPKVGFGAYIALALAIIIFSGVFYKMPDAYKWLGAFDYTTLIGKYGTIAGTASNFQGSGGFSARAASSSPSICSPVSCSPWASLRCSPSTALCVPLRSS